MAEKTTIELIRHLEGERLARSRDVRLWNGPICPECMFPYLGYHTCSEGQLRARANELRAQADQLEAKAETLAKERR